MTTKIISSHGYFRADETGKVIICKLASDFGPKPVFVNWTEWDKTYAGESRPKEMDILDIGYIDDIGDYEPPCADWRGDRKDRLAENEARTRQLEDIIKLCKFADLIYVDGLHPTDDWDVDEDGPVVLEVCYGAGEIARFNADELMCSEPSNDGIVVTTDNGITKLEFYALSRIHVLPGGSVTKC